MTPPVAVFFVALAVYVFTCYPAVAPRDAADLARAAVGLGVAHPPGYPLYSLLGHAWLSVFPWGEAAYRLNVLAAAAGAAAAALLTLAAGKLGRAAGWVAGLSFAFCAPLWKFSLLTEMYSLQACFAAALLALALGERRSFTRRAALSGLLLGLGLVNHQSLVLMTPAWAWLWDAERKRHGLTLREGFGAAAMFAFAGLMLYAAVPIRLADPRLGWAVIARAEYGSLTLFGGFAKPFAQAAPGLLRHWLSGWIQAGSLPLAAAGLWGFWTLRGTPGATAAALGVAAAGPFFFLLTRFDVSSWVARTALEPAFLLSALWLCVGAGAATAALERRRAGLGTAVGAALALSVFLANAPRHFHRDDFGAFDYTRNVLRAIPPGAAAIVRGDTALFGLRYLEPRLADREIVSELEPDLGGWVARRRGRRPIFSVGMPLEEADRLSEGKTAEAGLALSLDGVPAPAQWEIYAIRRFTALKRGESYALDAALSYAFARHTAARLAERAGRDGTAHAVAAAAWDPVDFRIEVEGAKGL